MKDGGQVFPGQQGTTPDGIWNQTWDPGMSLRDWFAGMYLSGVAQFNRHDQMSPERRCNFAYMYADAMIAERSKE